jgi:hypothetical protein
MRALTSLFALGFVLFSCGGTTGSSIVTFSAYAAGPEGADPSTPLTFTNGYGWSITLTKATLHLGAVYLNSQTPVSGAQQTSCILPGIYVAEVAGGIDVNALSGALQPFSVAGDGIGNPALTGEVWMFGGTDINDAIDPTVILSVAGIATKGTDSLPFFGQITISSNRQLPTQNPATPGANPICEQPIVTPVSAGFTPQQGGSLVLRVRPQAWFAAVDFSGLTVPAGASVYTFGDDDLGGPDFELYTGLRSTAAYAFSWQGSP